MQKNTTTYKGYNIVSVGYCSMYKVYKGSTYLFTANSYIGALSRIDRQVR